MLKSSQPTFCQMILFAVAVFIIIIVVVVASVAVFAFLHMVSNYYLMSL